MDSSKADHPTTEELLAYPVGELTEARARAVFNHCSGCPECGRQLAMILQLRAEAVAQASMEADVPSKRPWRWMAAAAAAILMVGAFMIWNLIDRGPYWPESPYNDLVTDAPMPRGWYDFRFGGALSTATGGDLTRAGLEALVDERYDEAIALLEESIERTPTDTEAIAYLGIARYLTRDVSDETIEMLRTGTSDRFADRIAKWYLANALLVRGNLEEARSVLDDLSFHDDRSGRLARALLARLPDSGS